ncbi:hypothetical protein RDABS01_005758 [Bienertia sinuspersici]
MAELKYSCGLSFAICCGFHCPVSVLHGQDYQTKANVNVDSYWPSFSLWTTWGVIASKHVHAELGFNICYLCRCYVQSSPCNHVHPRHLFQAKLSKIYPNPYSTTAMMNVMGSLQAILFALFADHDWQHWKLGWDIRLVTVSVSVRNDWFWSHGGFDAWCNRTKGPLFVSIFSPVCLVVVTLVGTLILGDKLYLGSVLGSIVIVLGLYAVVWAKSKEKESIQCYRRERARNSLMRHSLTLDDLMIDAMLWIIDFIVLFGN